MKFLATLIFSTFLLSTMNAEQLPSGCPCKDCKCSTSASVCQCHMGKECTCTHDHSCCKNCNPADEKQ